MKYKTTAKAVKNGYYKIISAGYCDLQNLLRYKSPIAYSCGVYGWNFDIYEVCGVAITTGYRGMPSKNSSCDYKLIKEYEDKAQGKSSEDLDILLREFVNEATDKAVK